MIVYEGVSSMGLFKKKEKITLDQLSYLTISEVMSINLNGISVDLDKETKNTINSITMLSSLFSAQLYIMNYLGNICHKDNEQIGYDVGKSFSDALAYWHEKNGTQKETIVENLEIMMQFNNDIYNSDEFNDSTKQLDLRIYLYTNKRISAELKIDIDNIELKGIIAEYTKQILKQVNPILVKIIREYKIVYE